MHRLFGTHRNARAAWIITHINFSLIFLRTCGPSDYYNWTVSDEVSYIYVHYNVNIFILGNSNTYIP